MAREKHHHHGHHGHHFPGRGRTAYFKLSTKNSKQAHLFSIGYQKATGLLEKLKTKLGEYKVDFSKVFWIDYDKDQIYLQTVEDLREALKFSRFVVRLYVDSAADVAEVEEEDRKSSTSSFTKVSGAESSASSESES
uniref:PB1 domain-containing protein n=1 Tax=Caenorhabditis japonica TaxID=281687 RepID=A0A8R1ELX6_CAEJA